MSHNKNVQYQKNNESRRRTHAYRVQHGMSIHNYLFDMPKNPILQVANRRIVKMKQTLNELMNNYQTNPRLQLTQRMNPEQEHAAFNILDEIGTGAERENVVRNTREYDTIIWRLNQSYVEPPVDNKHIMHIPLGQMIVRMGIFEYDGKHGNYLVLDPAQVDGYESFGSPHIYTAITALNVFCISPESIPSLLTNQGTINWVKEHITVHDKNVEQLAGIRSFTYLQKTPPSYNPYKNAQATVESIIEYMLTPVGNSYTTYDMLPQHQFAIDGDIYVSMSFVFMNMVSAYTLPDGTCVDGAYLPSKTMIRYRLQFQASELFIKAHSFRSKTVLYKKYEKVITGDAENYKFEKKRHYTTISNRERQILNFMGYSMGHGIIGKRSARFAYSRAQKSQPSI